MKRILSFLLHPVTLAVIGLLALAVIVFVVGPLVAIGRWQPLATLDGQLLFLAVVIAIVLLWWFVSWMRARARNRAVVAELGAAAPGAASGAAPAQSAELKQMQERFDAALLALRDARLGESASRGWFARLDSKRYLYQLPWYVIVGAPGSGKTTALLNSGLRFPLAGRMGEGAIKGVGGTRNCDWWFAEQAVLLDTAGRYTTHDSDPEADKQAWNGFLDLLKRTRPRRPLNGVLATVSISDLLTFSAEQREAYARTLRLRVDELQQRLGLRLPVYVMVTKCDLLAGFMEYFAQLDPAARNQPWGFTFAPEVSRAGETAAHFGAEFTLLCKRLFDGLVDRVQSEADRTRRSRVYAFPTQFGALRGALAEIIETLGANSTYAVAPQLRGVYFLSGTQEGTPFSRLLGAVSRQLHLDPSVLPPNRNSGRSYFINQVLSDVVFRESELAGANLVWERRQRIILWTSYAALALCSVALSAGWIASYLNNRADIAEFAERAHSLALRVESAPNRASLEIKDFLPTLDAAGALAAPGEKKFLHGLGLYQGGKLRDAAQLAYQRLLADGLLPRIAFRIEQLLRRSGFDDQLAYEALKSYVMLGSPENYDPKALKRFVGADFDANLQSELSASERAGLDAHMQALFDLPVAAAPFSGDPALIAQLRARLGSQPLAERVYKRLEWLGVGDKVPEFTIIREAGPQAQEVFVRDNDAPLTKGVPGLFTYEGYHKAFKQSVDAAAIELAAEESWVLGTQNTLSDRLQGPQVVDEVRRIYLNRYIQTWEAFIGGIHLARTDSLRAVMDQARILSAPNNPLVPLLRGIARETTLTASSTPAQDLVDKLGNKAMGAIDQSREKLARLLGNVNGQVVVASAPQPEKVVDDRFASIRTMVASGSGAPAPIDSTVALIGEVYNLLSAADMARQSKTPPPAAAAATLGKASAEAEKLPEPLRSVMSALADAGQRETSLGDIRNLSDLLNAEIGQFCQQAVEGRYPFVKTAEREVPPDDFVRLFAPGGKFDEFYTSHLTSLVDTSARPWKFRQVGNVKIGGNSATLSQFQRAAVIRDTFFRGGKEMGVKLEFVPYDMDPSIAQFNLDVDGQLVQWEFGPKLPKTVLWPGTRGANQVRLNLQAQGGSGSSVVIDGPWALFRLLDRMKVEHLNSAEKMRVTFEVDGRRAIFNVTASSVQNPIALRELSEFHCPTGL